MKKIYLFVITSALLLSTLSISAQVTGNKFIPGDYATLTAAIADLNTNGVGAGGATINIAAGFTETAPSGGYLLGNATLNVSLSIANPLVIRKDPATLGVNPLLTAPVGTSTTVDAIFKLQGIDYTTINGIDLKESIGNTTAATLMEWGYAFVNLNATDGCQNNTVQNCSITFLKTVNNPAIGIYMGHHIAANTTALTIATTTGRHDNNKIYSNIITASLSSAIYFNGFNAATPYTFYDQGNDVGGTSAATGNTIVNFGGLAGGSFYLTSVAIQAVYQNNANISYNTITNATDGLGFMGVYAFGTTSTFTVNNNTISGSGSSYQSGANTSSHYGIYSNSTGVNVTANNNTISMTISALFTGTAQPVMGIYVPGTGSFTANSNTVTTNNAVNSNTYGIYTVSAATININANTVSATTTGTTTANYLGIFSNGNATGTETINNNIFNNISSSSTTGSVFLINSTNTTNNKTISGNITSGTISKTGTGAGLLYGYYNNGAPTGGTLNIYNNNFSSISVTGTSGFIGINNAITGTTQTANIYNNIIGSVTLGSGNASGIFFSGAANGSLYGNRINSLSGTGGTLNGLSINLGLANNIYKNKIYDLQENNATGAVNGILVAGGTNASNNSIYNNLIGDLRAPITSASDAVRGIAVTSAATTSNINLYYNSIYLSAISTGTNFGSSGIFHTTNATATTANLVLRNNIIVNKSTANGTGLTVAIRRSGVGLANFSTTSDNNLFYSGVPSAANLIYYDGTTSYSAFGPVATPGTYQNFVATRDVASVTEDPNFLSTIGSSSNFLHINPTIFTLTESGAVNIAGITTDYDAEIRAGNIGYTGTGTNPDMGADEFDITIDVTAPDIVFTTLTATCSAGDRLLTATISDATGVPTAGTLAPRIYYKKGLLGTWYSQAGVFNSGSANNANFTFTIVAADMGGVTAGDQIYYYVIAQDVAAVPNIGSNAAGALATDVNTVAVPPLLPNSYLITPTLSGSYTVGVTGYYPTLTAAVAAYNSSCLAGPVVFSLIDNTYPSETFPIIINANANASGANTLTISPAASMTPTITGNNSIAIIKLNGADYITIDGSNNGTNSQNLTITNTNTAALGSQGIVWLSSPSAADGVTNTTIKNCILTGNANNTTFSCLSASGATMVSLAPAPNSNNTFQNNTLGKAQEGIFIGGNTATNDDNWNITQNTVGTVANNLGFDGMIIYNAKNYVVSNNTISNVSIAANPSVSGITLLNTHSNGNIYNNNINTIFNSSISFAAYGINLAAASTASNVKIYNNFISGVRSGGNATVANNGFGIYGTSGGGYNIYYNTISLGTDQTNGTGTTAAINITSGITTAGSVVLRNNILSNTQTSGTRYAIYSTAANTVFSAMDNNDYYSTGTNLGYRSGNLSNLAILQSATGFGTSLNLASVNALPTFTSLTDLHLIASANCKLDGAGNNNGILIPSDYDGNGRSIITPYTTDIGADEFTGTSAASNAALALAATNGLDLVKRACDEGGWTYYSDPTDATRYLFAINWDPSSAGDNVAAKAAATVQIHVDLSDFNAILAGTGTWTMKRYWNVNLHGNPLTGFASVRFFYDPADTAATGAAAAAYAISPGGSQEPSMWFKTVGTDFAGDAAHVNNDKVLNSIGLVNDAAPGSKLNGIDYAEFSSIVSFSGGGYASGVGPNTPLPVTFNYLRGVKQGSNHLLNWKVTCNSTPRVTLTLERSSDQRAFTDIYTITADAVRCQTQFDHADLSPLAGINYYRLRIVDAGGKVTYSNIISLLNAVKGFEVMNIAPNPVTTGSFKLNVTSANASKINVIITDMQGRVMSQQNISVIAGYNSIPINVANLAAGTYNISTGNAEDKSKMVRFVKQ